MNKKNSTLPSGWQLVTVGEVADLYRGISYKKQQSLNIPQKGYLPILRANNIGKNLNFENLVYVPEFLINRDQMINAGDIIFAMSSGSKHLVGKSAISFIDFHGSFGAFCGLLRPYKKINNQYLALYFQSNTFRKRISEISKGTNINNLKREHITDSLLPFPPENEQHRIVAKIEELFSELDKGVESLTTARKQLALYRQSLLKHAFAGKLTEKWRAEHAGRLETADQLLARIKKEREKCYQQQLADWEKAVETWKANGKEEKKPRKPPTPIILPDVSEAEKGILPVLPPEWQYQRLAEIANIGSGMSVSRNRKLADPVEVPYLRVANVQRGKLVLDEVKTMKIERDKLEDLKLKQYDILFNEGGDRDKLGRGWIWESQVEPCITQNHVFRATTYLGGKFHSMFISHWGNTFGQDYFEKSGKQTTNLASINKTVLSMFPIPMPSLKEQKKIIDEIDRAMSTISYFEKVINNELSNSEALRQSILKKAFSGQLVPQDPNDEPPSELLTHIRKEREKIQQETRKRPRKRRKKKEVKTMANILEIVRAVNDWLSAQDAFRQCGITDGAKTDAIEKIYEELRDNVHNNRIAVERRGDEDWLRAVQRG